MSIFEAPIEDYQFILHDMLAIERLPGFEDWTEAMTRPTLEAAARLSAEMLFPLNPIGDREGSRLVDGAVKTPTGFAEAYRRYCEDGWHIRDLPASIGGLGLPPVLANMILEIGIAANPSFMMYVGTAAIVAPALSGHGPVWLRDLALPHVLSGAWTGTMCLTEAHCGTDLRLMRTRATALPDGSYRIDGSKIFISSGDHDLGDNIIHVVLAKVPDEQGRITDDLATVGCFFVSKMRIDQQAGMLPEANSVTVGSIEKKMGLKGNATCVLNFDGAIAWPALSHGAAPDARPTMAAMFDIMNEARLATATCAVGVASTAVRSATGYARERLQSRAPTNRADPCAAPDPLIAQPDVRRLLLQSASFVEGARMALAQAACWRTLAAASPDEGERRCADDLLTLFQPVMKAFFSDRGCEVSNASLQLFGGHGYVHDHGMEQLVRDGRIYPIYEGANGVQAFDLVTRGLRSRGRDRIGGFMAVAQDLIAAGSADAALYGAGLERALAAVRDALQWLDDHADDANGRAGVSYDVMTLLGIALIAYSWTMVAQKALRMLEEGRGDTALLRRKLLLARLWMEREVTLCPALVDRIRYGADGLMALDEEVF